LREVTSFTMIGRQSSALAAPTGPKIIIPIVMMRETKAVCASQRMI
jgi:hypothetical protein